MFLPNCVCAAVREQMEGRREREGRGGRGSARIGGEGGRLGSRAVTRRWVRTYTHLGERSGTVRVSREGRGGGARGSARGKPCEGACSLRQQPPPRASPPLHSALPGCATVRISSCVHRVHRILPLQAPTSARARWCARRNEFSLREGAGIHTPLAHAGGWAAGGTGVSRSSKARAEQVLGGSRWRTKRDDDAKRRARGEAAAVQAGTRRLRGSGPHARALPLVSSCTPVAG